MTDHLGPLGILSPQESGYIYSADPDQLAGEEAH